MKVGETYQPEMSEFFKKWARMSPGLRGDPGYSPEVEKRKNCTVQKSSVNQSYDVSSSWCAGTIRVYGDDELKSYFQ